MSKRLIRRRSSPPIIQRHVRGLISRSRLISRLLPPASQRTLDPLILIGALLIAIPAPCRPVAVSLDPIAPPATAATAHEPEETGREGKRDAEPDGHIDALAQGAVDVVFLQGVVERGREGGVEDRGREGKGDEEEGTDGRDDRGGQAAETGEEGEDADEDLDNCGDERDDVGDEHPLGDDAVGV